MENFPIIGVHLDLKYMMPSKAYLKEWVRRLPGWGINTVLLEYEDKFPFQEHPFLQAAGAFTPQELRDFLDTARQAGIRVIPLVQSLSHLEFALAHPQLAHLRELPHIHTQINPSHPQAATFLNEYFDEVFAYHTDQPYVHIGGDEAWHLGHNPANKPLIDRLGKLGAWADHFRPLLQRLIQQGRKPIIWDDALWETPEKIHEIGLPKGTTLHSWNYGIRELKPDTLNLRCAKAFRQAGYDVLGGPCLNYGALTTRHQLSLDNTATWAEIISQAGLQGIINTAWACFHVLPHAQSLHIAATARAMQAGRAGIGPDWQEQFLAQEFGAPAEGMAAAFEDVGTNWEHKVEGLGRPITPIVYGYMDMVIHFDGQTRRRAEGIYPLNWGDIDSPGLFRRKMQILRDAPDRQGILAKLDELEECFARASKVFKRFASKAARHKDEADYLAWAADIKLLHAQVVRRQVTGEGDAKKLLAAWKRMRPRMEKVLKPFMEPSALEKALLLWWTPTEQALQN